MNIFSGNSRVGRATPQPSTPAPAQPSEPTPAPAQPSEPTPTLKVVDEDTENFFSDRDVAVLEKLSASLDRLAAALEVQDKRQIPPAPLG